MNIIEMKKMIVYLTLFHLNPKARFATHSFSISLFERSSFVSACIKYKR